MTLEPHTKGPAHSAGDTLRHLGGFVLAGVLALFVDIGVLRVLTDVAGLAVLVARPFSIALAMVVSWWVNRTVTFAVSTPARWSEFVKFAAVSWVAQAINYMTFTTILILRPATIQEAAIIVGSLVAMVVSYFGYRFGVFSQSGNGQSGQGK